MENGQIGIHSVGGKRGKIVFKDIRKKKYILHALLYDLFYYELVPMPTEGFQYIFNNVFYFSRQLRWWLQLIVFTNFKFQADLGMALVLKEYVIFSVLKNCSKRSAQFPVVGILVIFRFSSRAFENSKITEILHKTIINGNAFRKLSFYFGLFILGFDVFNSKKELVFVVRLKYYTPKHRSESFNRRMQYYSIYRRFQIF